MTKFQLSTKNKRGYIKIQKIKKCNKFQKVPEFGKSYDLKKSTNI